MTKRILSLLLAVIFILGIGPLPASAAEAETTYSISNGYLTYSINTKTGGFCIQTVEGHPNKQYDNDIPLLYKETRELPETSYVTVRIDGNDYIFGRNYGLFGLATTLSTPVVTNGGRMISPTWTIDGYAVTQTVAVSTEDDSKILGNLGIQYSVKNNSGSAGTVGIRVLLDTALGNTVDGPYVVADLETTANCMEHEYSVAAGNMPQQLRAVDALINAKKVSYLFFSGWNTDYVTPDRVIVGHWANLANTRYDYEPDIFCDYTNYSNEYRVPDTAYAIYWSEQELAAGATRTGELLYGVGTFSKETKDQSVGLDVLAEPVELNDDMTGYKSNRIKVTVNVDNALDKSVDLTSATVTLSVEQKLKADGTSVDDGMHVAGRSMYTFQMKKGEIRQAV